MVLFLEILQGKFYTYKKPNLIGNDVTMPSVCYCVFKINISYFLETSIAVTYGLPDKVGFSECDLIQRFTTESI